MENSIDKQIDVLRNEEDTAGIHKLVDMQQADIEKKIVLLCSRLKAVANSIEEIDEEFGKAR